MTANFRTTAATQAELIAYLKEHHIWNAETLLWQWLTAHSMPLQEPLQVIQQLKTWLDAFRPLAWAIRATADKFAAVTVRLPDRHYLNENRQRYIEALIQGQQSDNWETFHKLIIDATQTALVEVLGVLATAGEIQNTKLPFYQEMLEFLRQQEL